MADKTTIYQQVTDQVLTLMREHGSDWVKPWTSSNAGLPHNVETGRAYRGTNVLLLMLQAQAKGYRSNKWGTFRQWKNAGASVRKGEKATPAVFFKRIEVDDSSQVDEDGNPVKRLVPMAREFKVFNADQVEGYEEAAPAEPETEGGQAAEHWIANTGAHIHTAGEAFYVPALDSIGVPPLADFTSEDAYYTTLLHELTHWSGAEGRCDRQLRNRFGDEAYAMEELVAELGAAFQAVMLGVNAQPRADHAKYLNGWIRRLENDSRAFMHAATKAQEAVDYIEGLQDTPAEQDQAA